MTSQINAQYRTSWTLSVSAIYAPFCSLSTSPTHTFVPVTFRYPYSTHTVRALAARSARLYPWNMFRKYTVSYSLHDCRSPHVYFHSEHTSSTTKPNKTGPGIQPVKIAQPVSFAGFYSGYIGRVVVEGANILTPPNNILLSILFPAENYIICVIVCFYVP